MVSLIKIHNASQDDEPANISYRGVVNALNDDRRFNFLEVDGTMHIPLLTNFTRNESF